jgi:hypothetical protein
MSFFIENLRDRPLPDVAGWRRFDDDGGGGGSCITSGSGSVETGGSSWLRFLTILHTGSKSLRSRAIAS